MGSCHATAQVLRDAPTFTNRRLYLMRCAARPFGFFFLSAFATLGVCPLTLPARAKDPCTLPAAASTTKGRTSGARGKARQACGGKRRPATYPWLLVSRLQEKEARKPPSPVHAEESYEMGDYHQARNMQPTAREHDDRVRTRHDQLHHLPPT